MAEVKPWYCPACGAQHNATPLVSEASKCPTPDGGTCVCADECLRFAERVYREKFGTVPQSMSQVRRLGQQEPGLHACTARPRCTNHGLAGGCWHQSGEHTDWVRGKR